jgi:hypothetical protein
VKLRWKSAALKRQRVPVRRRPRARRRRNRQGSGPLPAAAPTWTRGAAERSSPSQGGDAGSIPVGSTHAAELLSATQEVKVNTSKAVPLGVREPRERGETRPPVRPGGRWHPGSLRGRSSMAERQSSKLDMRVRFPSPAQCRRSGAAYPGCRRPGRAAWPLAAQDRNPSSSGSSRPYPAGRTLPYAPACTSATYGGISVNGRPPRFGRGSGGSSPPIPARGAVADRGRSG